MEAAIQRWGIDLKEIRHVVLPGDGPVEMRSSLLREIVGRLREESNSFHGEPRVEVSNDAAIDEG